MPEYPLPEDSVLEDRPLSPCRKLHQVLIRGVPWALLAALAVGVSAPAALAQTAASEEAVAAAAPPVPLERSFGNANYRIGVRLDPETRTLDGRMLLTWTNIQEVATDELRFHLYWNAWRNDESSWMREAKWRQGRRQLRRRIDEGDWGWQQVDTMRLVSHSGEAETAMEHADLKARARFESPDDGNPNDRTVLVVPLLAPVGPGETVEVEMSWRAKVPRTFARTGFRGDYFFIAQWIPKLGVFEGEDGWNCHQFHAATEFFSDYGSYDVSIAVPEDFVVGATGRLKGVSDNGDGIRTHRFIQDDVHGFAWTASPHYREVTRRFEEPGLPPVEMRLLYQPEHEDQVGRHFAATAAALKHYGTWYGAYPYGHITVVDPVWGSRTGGMEYPTLFTCGTRIFNPLGGGSPEGVTIHEAGHQFWYGLVGNNEFEDAWIDEGLNTFSTARTYKETYGERMLVERYLDPPGVRWGGFLPFSFPGIRFDRAVGGNRLDGYREDALSDVQATPTWRYWPSTASSITYAKTSLWLATLERYLGWDVLREILYTFSTRYRFRHPGPQDFFAVANEVSEARRGENLDWYFDQVYRGSQTFDYAVSEVKSEPVATEGLVAAEEGLDGALTYQRGWKEERDGEPQAWRSQVRVQRLGDGVFAVEVLMVFEDGSEQRQRWDGRDRWTLLTHEGPSKLAHAVVDPERVLLLDLDTTNNSRLLESAPKLAAVKWASKWMVWLQDLLTTFTYFV